MRRLLLLLALASAAHADDLSVEQRLRKLEQEITALKAENEQLRRDLGLEVVARQADVKVAGSAENVQFGGMVQVQGDAGDRGDSRFTSSNARVFLRRARVNVAGRFIQEFNFRAELELAGSLSDSAGLRAQLTDAYLNWNRFDSAHIRVGQFKTPFGFEQLYADPRLYTIERSLANDRLTPGRQIGAQLSGEWLFDRISYSAGIFDGNGTNGNFNDNDRFLTAARVSVVPFSARLFDEPSRWSVGLNAYQTRDSNVAIPAEFGFGSTFAGKRRGFGADTQLELGRLELWAEVLRGFFDPDKGRTLHAGGGYGQAAVYMIEDKLQLVGRYETFTPNESASSTRARAGILGFNYYFKQHDLKLQIDLMREEHRQQKLMARLQTVF